MGACRGSVLGDVAVISAWCCGSITTEAGGLRLRIDILFMSLYSMYSHLYSWSISIYRASSLFLEFDHAINPSIFDWDIDTANLDSCDEHFGQPL